MAGLTGGVWLVRLEECEPESVFIRSRVSLLGKLLPSPPSTQGTGGTRLAEQEARAGDRPDPCRTDDDEEKEAPKSGDGRRSRRRWAQERQQPRATGSGAAVATTATTMGAAAARRLERQQHDVGDDEDDSDHERWQPGVVMA
uniref:Uncharacterized protein n=1 Tax=Oryza sativa subsp. japonica TaxID=39947 RepID=Q69U77_ORYSJ|nr:hypothetical protein [Oryza sativa Japonica Group]